MAKWDGRRKEEEGGDSRVLQQGVLPSLPNLFIVNHIGTTDANDRTQDQNHEQDRVGCWMSIRIVVGQENKTDARCQDTGNGARGSYSASPPYFAVTSVLDFAAAVEATVIANVVEGDYG